MNEKLNSRSSVTALIRSLECGDRDRDAQRLTDDEQALLASAYAYGLGAKEKLLSSTPVPSVRRTLREYSLLGERACEHLTFSLKGLVVTMANEFATARLGREWARRELDDLISEGLVVALEACAGYDASFGTTVAQWVATRVRSHLHAHDFSSGGGVVPREWKRIARAVHTMQEPTGAHGSPAVRITPDTVTEHLLEQETKRLLQKGYAPEEARVKARDVLSRQSLLRGVRELGAVVATAKGASSLDYSYSGEEDSLLDRLSGQEPVETSYEVLSDADALMTILAVLPAYDVMNTTTRYGSAGDEVSYRALAEETGQEWLTIRHGVDRVKAAPAAPHAQFSAFYPHAGAMVVASSTGRTTAVADATDNELRSILAANLADVQA